MIINNAEEVTIESNLTFLNKENVDLCESLVGTLYQNSL